MKFRIKGILLVLLLLFVTSAVKAQEPITSPTPPLLTDEDSGGGTPTDLIVLNVSVQSRKKGYLKDLTYKDFEVYDEKELQEIEFFTFDETKNQYILGFYKEDFTDNKWHNLKVKIKLSKEKQRIYGKISVTASKEYYSGNPKSKI